jgi:hypothetical protein
MQPNECTPIPGRKFRGGGLDANTKVYGFYVRLHGESREQFREVKKSLTASLGAEPSNPMVFDFLLRHFIAEGSSASEGRSDSNA